MALENIDPVIVNFAIKGLPDVERALDRLTSLIRKAENNNARASADGAKARVASAKAAADRIVKDNEEAERKRGEEFLKTAAKAEKAAEKERRSREREYDRLFREVERKEKAISDAVEREASRRSAIYQREASRRTSSIVGAIGSTVNRGAMLATAAAGIGGGFAVADVMRQQFAAEKQAALLVNLVTANGKTPQGATVENILGKASEASVATGMDKSDVMSAMVAYAQSAKGGDFGGIMSNIPFITKFSGAFGADATEVARGLGSLQSQNQGATPDELKGLLLSARAQSVAGVMGVSELVPQLGELGAATAAFSGNTTANQRQLMALMQLGAQVGPHGDAGTYVKDFAEELVKKRDKAEALGIQFDKSGKVNSIEQAISSMFTHSRGDLKPMLELLGARGGKIPEALASEYEKGAAGKSGNDAVKGGVDAVMRAFHNLADAGMTEAELEREHAKSLDTNGQRINLAFNKIRESLAQNLEGPLTDFTKNGSLDNVAKAFGNIASLVGKTAGVIAENPAMSLTALITGNIAKNIAFDKIGDIVGKSLAANAAKSLGLGAEVIAVKEAELAASVALTGGIGGTVTVLSAFAVALGVAAGATYLLISAMDKAEKERQQEPGKNTTELDNISAKIAAGTATPEEIAHGKELAEKAHKNAQDLKTGDFLSGTFGGAFDAVSRFIGAGTPYDDKRKAEKKMGESEEESVQHFVDLTKALDQLKSVITDQFGRVTPQIPTPASIWRPGQAFDMRTDNPMVKNAGAGP